MKINYNLQDKFDFSIFIPLLGLVLLGLLAVYSSTYENSSASNNFERQFIFTVISFVIFFVIYFLPSHTFRITATPIYILSQILLIAVLIIGRVTKGAKSWLDVGFVGFQPSEFAKVGLILFLAYWLSHKKHDINNFKELLSAVGIGFIPIILIILEPDMGTAIVFVVITLVMIFWSGIDLFGLFAVLSPGIAVFASLFGIVYFMITLFLILLVLISFRRDLFLSTTIFVVNIAAGFVFEIAYKFLRPHQQRRIESFIDPYSDPLGSGYNAIQAKVAIGSGGLLGKGFLEGNQTQLRFIPEQWTDFIFCVIGEEFGFIGSLLVLILFLILFMRLINLSQITKDKFSSLIVVGIISLIATHFTINIGMNLGITPVIGLPLPFLSYGGSSLLVNISLIAVALNIYRNRKYSG
ncbi:MAG: rod shape-determining protein RodA [Melioribacteraceae bacterium]|nr:rod shape-determining protein RodA [Melioribacteraceae bacterium]